MENEVDPDPDLDPGFLVKNRGCRIAALQPIDEFSKRFIEVMKPIECEFGNQLPLVESNDTFLFINKDAISQYYNDTETIDCCWRSFTRKKYSDNSFKYVPTQLSKKMFFLFIFLRKKKKQNNLIISDTT